jgi:hypothetical protein
VQVTAGSREAIKLGDYNGIARDKHLHQPVEGREAVSDG